MWLSLLVIWINSFLISLILIIVLCIFIDYIFMTAPDAVPSNPHALCWQTKITDPNHVCDNVFPHCKVASQTSFEAQTCFIRYIADIDNYRKFINDYGELTSIGLVWSRGSHIHIPIIVDLDDVTDDEEEPDSHSEHEEPESEMEQAEVTPNEEDLEAAAAA